MLLVAASGRAVELSKENRARDKNVPQKLCMHGVSRDESLQACCKEDGLEFPGMPVKCVLTLYLEQPLFGHSLLHLDYFLLN